MEEIKSKKKELKAKIKEFERKIGWEPAVSFTRPGLIQEMNLVIGELKGIKLCEKLFAKKNK